MKSSGSPKGATQPKGDYSMSEFNPEIFGFEVYAPVSVGRSAMGGDYVRYTVQRDGRETTSISLCEETSAFVRDLLGDSVGIAMNDKGVILLFPPSGYKSTVSHRINKVTKNALRWEISCAGLAPKFKRFFGEFRRLPVSVDVYAKGNAIILKPDTSKIER